MKLRIICPSNAANPTRKVLRQSTLIVLGHVVQRSLHEVSAPAVQATVKTESFRVPWPWVFRLFNPSYTHKKCRNCDLMLFCKTIETFVYLHMCNPALSKLIFNLLTGRVSRRAILLPPAASFESRFHFRPHTFHFVYTFHSTCDAQDTHSELKAISD